MTTERALIARGMQSCIVLATDGQQIAWQVAEISDVADEALVSFVPQEPGFYLLECVPKTVAHATMDGWEPELEFEGTIRPVKPEELTKLLAMSPPPEDPVL